MEKQNGAEQSAHAETETAPHEGENMVSLSGKCATAPKSRIVLEDRKVTRFLLMVERTYRGPRNKPGQQTAFVPVAAWQGLAEKCEGLGKGSAVRVQGRIRTWREGEKSGWEVEAEALDVLDRRADAPAEKVQGTLGSA